MNTTRFNSGQKVKYIRDGKIYDFGYYGMCGSAIICREGEQNMQDSIAVNEDDLEAVDRKWLRVLADYGCSYGLWAQEGCPAEINEIPLPKWLIDELSHWCGMYERNDDYYPEEERRKPPFPLEFFSAWGEDIAKEIKIALPDWTILYYNDFKSHNAPEDCGREIYEYEIGLPTTLTK